jgi:trehalose-phosphatase
MRSAKIHASAILKKIQQHGSILMLDFDGTLSPIVADPGDAVLPSVTRKILKVAVKRFPVAVISGRSLQDIRHRVGIRGVVYAGSHGSEWKIGKRRYRHPAPRESLMALDGAIQSLTQLSKTYPGLILETKPMCFAINYRSLTRSQTERFRMEAQTITLPFTKKGILRIMDSMCTFEITPYVEWSKGDVARLIFRSLSESVHNKTIPIYIGDSLTDEDVFYVFREGITIRVGKSTRSAARYYLRNCEEVAEFISFLVSGIANDRKHS